MTENARILFVHIPKTAGISLFSALAAAVGEEQSIRFADASRENREKYLAMSDAEVRNYRLVSGHFPLAFYFKKPVSDYQIITVLRDAVDRELSAYFYMKTWEEHPRHTVVGKMDLHQFFEHREKVGRPNEQCAILSGSGSFQAAKKAIEKHRIFAAPTEYLGDFCKALEHRLRIGPLTLKRENVTKSRLRVDEIPAEIRKRLQALTEDDQKLYEYVKQKFESEVLGR